VLEAVPCSRIDLLAVVYEIRKAYSRRRVSNLALRTRSHKACANATFSRRPCMLASHSFPSTLPYILLFTHYPSVEVLFIAPPSSPRPTLSATAVVPSTLSLPLIGLHEGRKRCLSVEPRRARYFRLRPSKQKDSDGPDRKVSILSAQPLQKETARGANHGVSASRTFHL